jgi:hypothetical protein
MPCQQTNRTAEHARDLVCEGRVKKASLSIQRKTKGSWHHGIPALYESDFFFSEPAHVATLHFQCYRRASVVNCGREWCASTARCGTVEAIPVAVGTSWESRDSSCASSVHSVWGAGVVSAPAAIAAVWASNEGRWPAAVCTEGGPGVVKARTVTCHGVHCSALCTRAAHPPTPRPGVHIPPDCPCLLRADSVCASVAVGFGLSLGFALCAHSIGGGGGVRSSLPCVCVFAGKAHSDVLSWFHVVLAWFHTLYAWFSCCVCNRLGTVAIQWVASSSTSPASLSLAATVPVTGTGEVWFPCGLATGSSDPAVVTVTESGAAQPPPATAPRKSRRVHCAQARQLRLLFRTPRTRPAPALPVPGLRSGRCMASLSRGEAGIGWVHGLSGLLRLLLGCGLAVAACARVSRGVVQLRGVPSAAAEQVDACARIASSGWYLHLCVRALVGGDGGLEAHCDWCVCHCDRRRRGMVGRQVRAGCTGCHRRGGDAVAVRRGGAGAVRHLRKAGAVRRPGGRAHTRPPHRPPSLPNLLFPTPACPHFPLHPSPLPLKKWLQHPLRSVPVPRPAGVLELCCMVRVRAVAHTYEGGGGLSGGLRCSQKVEPQSSTARLPCPPPSPPPHDPLGP